MVGMLWFMNSIVWLLDVILFMWCMYFCWNGKLFMVRILLMIKILGLRWVVIVKVSCICILFEYCFMGSLRNCFMFVKLMILLKWFWMFLCFIFRMLLFRKMFLCFVSLGWKLVLILSRFLILLCRIVLFWVGEVIFERIFNSVFLFVLFLLIIVIVLFDWSLKLMFCIV